MKNSNENKTLTWVTINSNDFSNIFGILLASEYFYSTQIRSIYLNGVIPNDLMIVKYFLWSELLCRD